ncbi:hypothetical protein [Lysinibacillus telephonicus]|uniref:hypothetical protein n=1 Tax=Lysinibacillus telephonicus TaxID=1714840 RepID=UPI003B9E79F6
MKSREQGGKKVRFAYDTEEQLIAVFNEKGEAYQFERDAKGNIIKEIGFDDMTRTYERVYRDWFRELIDLVIAGQHINMTI